MGKKVHIICGKCGGDEVNFVINKHCPDNPMNRALPKLGVSRAGGKGRSGSFAGKLHSYDLFSRVITATCDICVADEQLKDDLVARVVKQSIDGSQILSSIAQAQDRLMIWPT